ncbi:MAG: DUF2304 domain-containing protein [Bacteroidetes bacterium]|nr:DUF2304 domain-containing protein [Bacteroidota bacterium]
MPLRLKIFTVIIGLTIFLGIIELVRRRKLREEYSFIWLMAGFAFILIAVQSDVLDYLSGLIGIALPVNTLFFVALVFIVLLCLYFSLRISALTTQVKNLAQQIALLQAKEEGNNSLSDRNTPQ